MPVVDVKYAYRQASKNLIEPTEYARSVAAYLKSFKCPDMAKEDLLILAFIIILQRLHVSFETEKITVDEATAAQMTVDMQYLIESISKCVDGQQQRE